MFSGIYHSGDKVKEVAVKVLKDEESWHAEQVGFLVECSHFSTGFASKFHSFYSSGRGGVSCC